MSSWEADTAQNSKPTWFAGQRRERFHWDLKVTGQKYDSKLFVFLKTNKIF
jgi:hypothetical protein